MIFALYDIKEKTIQNQARNQDEKKNTLIVYPSPDRNYSIWNLNIIR